MKSTEFLNEVLSSDICPDNFEKIYKEFQGFQELSLNALKEFHRICEKFSVPYQLTGGSLLGAVRDGGQIPWDYDVDVFVPYQEKDRLIAALKQELAAAFYFYCPEICSTCRHYCMRISPSGYRSEVLHVDVFYLIGAPDDDAERSAFSARVAELAHRRFGKLVNVRQESAGSLRRLARLMIKNKLPNLFVSLDDNDKEYARLCSEHPYLESNTNISADTYSADYQYPTALLTETKIITTAYGEARMPVRYDELLKIIYGDYMMIPPLKSRIGELLFNYNRIKYFMR